MRCAASYYAEWALVQTYCRASPTRWSATSPRLEALVLGDQVSYVFWVAALIDAQERFVGAVLVGRYLDRLTAEAAVGPAPTSRSTLSGGQVVHDPGAGSDGEPHLAPEVLNQALSLSRLPALAID
jgi:hypothetical protein